MTEVINQSNEETLAVELFLHENYLFRKPKDGEPTLSMTSSNLLEIIASEFPAVKTSQSTKVHLGKTMNALGYESTNCGHITHYKVVLKNAA